MLRQSQGAEAEPVLAAAIWGTEVLSGTRLDYVHGAIHLTGPDMGDG